ncbi:MAG: AbrB/MazE/SpoVT family DNA-binding domain-containing protein [Nanoarchaeota archaeon]
MKRKVIQIADSTQLVSLPRKWAVRYGVKKGDELDVIEQGNRIIIGTEGKGEREDKIELNITELDKDSVIFLIRGLYVKGYDEITLTFDRPLTTHHRVDKKVRFTWVIHNEARRSTGLEIISEKTNTITLKRISQSSIKEFDGVLRRVFMLTIDAAKDLYLGCKEGDFDLVKSLEEKHDNITRFVFYNLRLLNTMSHMNYRDTPSLFHITSSLDIVVDILRNAARDIADNKIKPSKAGIEILGQIYKSMELYYNLYYDFSFKKCEQFSEMRDKILNEIKDLRSKLTKEDIYLSTATEHCLEILRYLFSARISLQY